MSNEMVVELTGSGDYYLGGNFAPVPEERTVLDLEVVGEIPQEISGRYIRNGPNPDPIPSMAYHWFMGDGMLHGIEIREGRALCYKNRWVRTEGFALRHGLEPPAGPPDVVPAGMNPANTHVVAHAGRLFALCEVGLPYEVTPDLETVGKYDFAGRLKSAMTAHPKLDPATGEMHFFGYSMFGPPYLRYHVVGADGELRKTVELEMPAPVMVHDFSITENHVVFYDLPVVLDLSLLDKTPIPFRWDPAHGARLGVMPKGGDAHEIQWYEVEPCYVFHQLNAFEQGSEVVVDVARFESMFVVDEEGRGGKVAPSSPSLSRWRVDLEAGGVSEEVLEEEGFDFPRVDDRLIGFPARYGYGVEVENQGAAIRFGNLVKYDLREGAKYVHRVGLGRVAGEGVFVPVGPNASEGEGWVMAYVYDTSGDRSELVVIDADDFESEPVARVMLPFRVPFGFHGSWLPD